MTNFSMEYKLRNLYVSYPTRHVWNDCRDCSVELIKEGHDSGIIIIIVNDIELTNLYSLFIEKEELIRKFILALKIHGNYNLHFNRVRADIEHNGKIHELQTKETVGDFIKYINGETAHYSIKGFPPAITNIEYAPIETAKLPEKLLSVPLDLERLVVTIALANQVKYKNDLMLKICFIILEEYSCEVDPDLYNELRLVRNFVSHPICRDTEILKMLDKNRLNRHSAEGAKFNRTDTEHLAFITKKAFLALEIATNIVKNEITNNGGMI